MSRPTFYDMMHTFLEDCKDSLREHNLPEESIDAIVGGPSIEDAVNNLLPKTRYLTSNSTRTVTTHTNYGNDNHGSDYGTYAINTMKADAPSTNPDGTVKFSQSWIGKPGVVIVLDYTPKVHAIFGDFAKTYAGFRNEYLKTHPYFQYVPKLTFGAGWTMRDKDQLKDLKKEFRIRDIPFREVSKDEYIKELQSKVKGGSKSTDSNASSERNKALATKPEEISDISDNSAIDSTIESSKEENTKKIVKEVKAPSKPIAKENTKVPAKEIKEVKDTKKENTKENTKPKAKEPEGKADAKTSKNSTVSSNQAAKEPPKKGVRPEKMEKTEQKEPEKKKGIVKNKHGNYVDEDSGLVFAKLPVGPKGKIVNIVVGYQDPDPAKTQKGLDCVLPLTQDHIEEAEAKSFSILTDNILEKVKEKDESLYDQLITIAAKAADLDDDLGSDISDGLDDGEDDDDFGEDDEDDV